MKIVLKGSTRNLIIIIVLLVVVAIVIAGTYYSYQNRSVDPRIKEARRLYASYNQYAKQGDYFRIFDLLDSIEDIYASQIHYSRSFERGVIQNNRAAAFLILSMHGDQIAPERNPFYGLSADTLITLAEEASLKSISIYEDFIQRFDTLPPTMIPEIIRKEFMAGLDTFPEDLKERYLSSRVKEIERSRTENLRRLSVSYTNYGIALRLESDNLGAAKQYEKALELWDMNLQAENNLNRLLGRPLRKRNFIQKLFPPDRNLK
jgi:hypothetical protein